MDDTSDTFLSSQVSPQSRFPVFSASPRVPFPSSSLPSLAESLAPPASPLSPRLSCARRAPSGSARWPSSPSRRALHGLGSGSGNLAAAAAGEMFGDVTGRSSGREDDVTASHNNTASVTAAEEGDGGGLVDDDVCLMFCGACLLSLPRPAEGHAAPLMAISGTGGKEGGKRIC